MKVQHQRTLVNRLRDAIAIARCDGGPVFVQRASPPMGGDATGRGAVRLIDELPAYWQCSNAMDDCNGCPRFKAFRQGIDHGKFWADKLNVPSGAAQVKPDIGDRHSETAEVDDIDHQHHCARRVCAAYADENPDTHSVLNPVAPSVIQAKNSAKHCNGKCHGLHHVCSNSDVSIVAQGGAA